MSIQTNDLTGQMRRPEDFAEAERVIKMRILTFPPPDIELFMQFTTILEALRIAQVIASATRQSGQQGEK